MKRRRAAVAGVLAAVALAVTAVGFHQKARARPTLLVLTSLPLLFGETFGLDQPGSPTLERLQERFVIQPIAATDQASLAGAELLLMAHPRAQTAEALVELDQWVTDGGRLLLLADPKLDWPSARPFGDTLRPPPWFADTGLLIHWGVRLTGGHPDGPAVLEVRGRSILAASPGRFELLAGSRCTLEASGFIADCPVGKGRAVLIADADFLNVAGEGALDGPTDANLDLLLDELDSLAE